MHRCRQSLMGPPNQPDGRCSILGSSTGDAGPLHREVGHDSFPEQQRRLSLEETDLEETAQREIELQTYAKRREGLQMRGNNLQRHIYSTAQGLIQCLSFLGSSSNSMGITYQVRRGAFLERFARREEGAPTLGTRMAKLSCKTNNPRALM